MVGNTLRTKPSARRRARFRAGFTVVELMAVVAMIGVLASVAIPSFQRYVNKAKRNEAYLVLENLYNAQARYRLERGRYAGTFDEMNFRVLGGRRQAANIIQTSNYTYELTPLTVDGVVGAHYECVATGDLVPGDSVNDILIVGSNIVVPN